MALLDQLLAAWAATHDPALEEPITRHGAAAAADAAVADNGNDRAAIRDEAGWHAVAAAMDPADVARLLAVAAPPGWKQVHARIAALARFPGDPRIARGALALGAGQRAYRAYPVHREITALLGRAPFAGLVAAIDQLPQLHPQCARGYPLLRIAAAAAARGEADPALLAAAGRVASPTARIDELHAAHARDPGNLALRAVLADALLEHGDPRGELIALQTAVADGVAGPDAAARIAMLLDTHARAWTGPLPGVERASRRFARGFVVALRISASAGSLAPLVDRPEWATLEELALLGPQQALAALLARMPLLHTLVAPPPLPGPEHAFPGIRALGIRGRYLPPTLAAFPGLRVLAGAFLDPATRARLTEVQAHAVALGVRAICHLGLPLALLPEALAARAAGPAETRLVVGRSTDVRFDPGGWRLAVPRTGDRARLAWADGAAYATPATRLLAAALASSGLREVSVHLAGRLAPTMRRDLAAHAGDLALDFTGAPIDLAQA